jgi:hypothetical protein
VTVQPFTPSWIRWYNAEDGSKVASADVGSYEDIPYGAQKTGERHAAGKPPHPEHGQWQWGLACSRASRTIVIDIDKPAAWKQGSVFVELGEIAGIAGSYREDMERFHVAVEVPGELLAAWPVQGPAVWGDVKSNGFSYIEGVHHTGMRYIDAGRPWIVADASLMEALTADRIFPQGRGATGIMAGPWEDDSYRIESHDECVATVMSMVSAGMEDEAVTGRLAVIMPNREGDWPGRDAYIEEKIRSARRKIEARERKEREFWGAFHPGGYEGLVGMLARRQADNIERATPQGTAADAAEWIEHRIAEGVNLKRTPLDIRLNPWQRPVEPRAAHDKGNALDILEAGMPVFRFASDVGCWLQHTGTHWEAWGTKSEKLEIGRAIVSAYGSYLKSDETLSQELAAAGTAESDDDIKRDDDRRDRLKKSRFKYLNSAGQNGISTGLVTEARGSDRYCVNVAELDAEADVLWAGGYPWSLRHPELTLATAVRPVNPVHLKTAACAPIPWIECHKQNPDLTWESNTPAFDQVLAAVWPDEDVRAWALREICGVALWGSTSKMHPVLDGPAGGGKSTFVLILKRALGTYAVQVSPDKILGGDQNSSYEEEVAAMIGARLVWMDEPPPGGRQAVSRFNDLASGTGDISAARKFENRVSAPKLFNFLICQNPRNALRMDAQGVGERMTLIPCHGSPEVTLAAWKRWKTDGEAEYAAVLARLIRECALFHLGDRPESPMEALMARSEAQERADEFSTWVLEGWEALPDMTVTVDPRLDESPTVGYLRTLYNGSYARDNRLTAIGAAEARDQLARLRIRVATGGCKRRKDVVFIKAKAVSYGAHY